MKRYVLGLVLAITVAVGCAYAATWTSLPLDENLATRVAECFSNGTEARVAVIYSTFEGDVAEIRCYPQGGVN